MVTNKAIELDLPFEPSYEIYRRLIEIAIDKKLQFLLVRRHDLDLSELGEDILRQLQTHLIEEKVSYAWPGTELGASTKGASVFRYALTERSAAILLESATGLYSWVQPELPEDLSFVRHDGSPFLVNTAHDLVSYFCIEKSELADLEAALPELLMRRADRQSSDSE